jgi:hypothetical protein
MKRLWVIYREFKDGEKYPRSKHRTKEAAINKCTQMSLKNPKAKFVIQMEIK